jgi:SAM-dependent methyltransferase
MTAGTAEQVHAQYPFPHATSAREWVECNYDFKVPPRAIGPFFMNYGLWYRTTNSLKQSSENLMEALTANLDHKGSILDVACGYGATTQWLSERWEGGKVTGANVTETQVKYCRENVPGCKFHVMDAARLEFEKESFDSILAVEAALHFDTREAFFRHAHRILRKGGVLALSDLLVVQGAQKYVAGLPDANFIPTLADYRKLLLEIGFSRVELVDISEEGMNSHFSFQFTTAHENWMHGKIDFEYMRGSLGPIYMTRCLLMKNLICVAYK